MGTVFDRAKNVIVILDAHFIRKRAYLKDVVFLLGAVMKPLVKNLAPHHWLGDI
jgi:hypothetical protein